MPLGVRPATADDAPTLARIYVDSWNAGFGHLMGEPVLDDDRILRWRAELATARTRWWVAEQDETVLGFVGIGPCRDPVEPGLGELDTIAVDPAHWRGGVGSALMRTALDALAEAGFTEALLWTPAGYDRGHGFYAAMGWSRDGGTRDDGRQVSFRYRLRQDTPSRPASESSDSPPRA